MPLANHVVTGNEFHKGIAEGTIGKLSHSTWMITINTNKRNVSQEYLNKFTEGMNVLFDDSGNGLLDYIEPGKNNDPDYREKIEAIIIDGAFENLSDTADLHLVQLHLHVVVDVTHRTNISLNFNNLKKDISSFMPGVYVHIKMIERAVTSIADYVHKWDQNKIGRNAPEISIKEGTPSFRDWLQQRGVNVGDKIKSNFTKKMEKTGGKSILGQIMSRPSETHKELVMKVGKKFGKASYMDTLMDLIDRDPTITDEEIDYFKDL